MLLVLLFFVQVVEEDAAHATGLAPVRDVEVSITPCFEARVIRSVVLVAGVFDGAVEVDGVFVEEVARRQVRAAAEPPGFFLTVLVHCLEVAVVEMHGRGIGVVRMEHTA